MRPAARPETPQIAARSLDEYVEAMRAHETHPVPGPRPLTLGAWIGGALVAGLAVGIELYSNLTHRVVEGS